MSGFKSFRTYFVSGLVILAPFFLTVWVLLYLVRIADRVVVSPVFYLLPLDLNEQYRIFLAKVLIAVAVVLFVTLLGMAAQKFIFKRLFAGIESVILGIPVFNRVYRSFKDISQAIFGEKSGIFKRVVLLEYPRLGTYSVGFVTNENAVFLQGKVDAEMACVFVPSPPNPATGFSVTIPKKDLIESGMTIEEGIRFIVSCGAVSPSGKSR